MMMTDPRSLIIPVISVDGKKNKREECILLKGSDKNKIH